MFFNVWQDMLPQDTNRIALTFFACKRRVRITLKFANSLDPKNVGPDLYWNVWLSGGIPGEKVDFEQHQQTAKTHLKVFSMQIV